MLIDNGRIRSVCSNAIFHRIFLLQFPMYRNNSSYFSESSFFTLCNAFIMPYTVQTNEFCLELILCLITFMVQTYRLLPDIKCHDHAQEAAIHFAILIVFAKRTALSTKGTLLLDGSGIVFSNVKVITSLQAY